ncbi:MAG TPA: hypothetical protein DEE98_00510 [Elusimicrobia bacterium]|nr:MAG: hypothetical protein A2278_03140 [Elusimicrobia bacterium RIFOXYA12_FULL_49_49]OGS09671.1 MAG: hypothetical protein A2386_01200 [Elusimicrobia bacterium RIFOXYB1_FULL_48_9]OGS15560.1 MAG: hypothetical protein A2251_03390 [Elusimicrobia bacterium RIFOXYA2_FULL_47_53]OGS26884.1 MAG: hypothetical protein A2339_07590 [Elusimicrobia bacterium RIFOXYB12_FULL_50_12]OGS30659.1 MAG: hypothetical protein A2323_07195 [Elusimicrobia bacterium RIFOXYB2_FULL_46_23]HBU68847.1 hypothetical protein [El
MKCYKCQSENKENTKNCKKCGADLTPMPLWKPTWKWHARTLGAIFGALIAAYFLLNHLLKPYMRQIPSEITPWLAEAQKQDAAEKK